MLYRSKNIFLPKNQKTILMRMYIYTHMYIHMCILSCVCVYIEKFYRIRGKKYFLDRNTLKINSLCTISNDKKK